MKKYGYEDRGTKKLELDFWLAIGRNATSWSGAPSVKVFAGYPSLARNERAINLKMSLPLALFEAPSLSATIKVDQPTQVVHIDAEAVAEAVRGIIGMDVEISVVEPSE